MDAMICLILLILLIVACEAIAQSCANELKHTGSVWYLFIGALFYMLVVYLLSESHKLASMGVVNAIWSGLSVLAIASVGTFYYGQKITPDQIAVMSVIACGVAYLAKNYEPSPG